MSTIKKKGGIIIKNKLFFLITVLSIYFLSITKVYAENANFYEGEYIDDIYMSKYEYSTDTIYYQKARFFRKEGTNEYAYCIEPFHFFVDGSIYESTNHITSLPDYKIERIKKIAHFGYQYKNHTDQKWYAITQMMIWKEAGEGLGDFFFTDTLNGNKIYPYQEEMQEIENLIANYNLNPIPSDKIYKVMEDKSLAIFVGSAINDYKSSTNHIRILNGNIEIRNLKEGYYEFTLTREEQENNPIIFYQSSNSQTLMENGGIPNKETIVRVEVEKGSIIINKIDQDNNDTNPQGEGELDGAVYGLYLERNDSLIEELTIENNKAFLENPNYGTYYIQEITPGKGYTLNEEKYKVEITFNNFNVELDIPNKIIEKKIKIIKQTNDNNLIEREAHIQFEIYNTKNEIVKTVETNEQGEIEIILPYGTYIVKQLNTKEGYEKVDDFSIIVDNIEDEQIELIDYKIHVPDTYSRDNNILWILFIIINIII